MQSDWDFVCGVGTAGARFVETEPGFGTIGSPTEGTAILGKTGGNRIKHRLTVRRRKVNCHWTGFADPAFRETYGGNSSRWQSLVLEGILAQVLGGIGQETAL